MAVDGSEQWASPSPPATAAGDPILVKVLSLNVAIGGDAVDLARTIEAIRASDADIVGVQEANGNLLRMADLLGWAHADERHQVLSRWPVVEPHQGRDRYVYVHPVPDGVVAVGNVHLPDDPYGPYLLRAGRGVAEVLGVEDEVRGAAFRAYAPAWSALLEDGIALVVTGDFNAPSHLDWGPHAAGHRVAPVDWPVSLAARDLGLVDTYRTANPDRAGITWTYGFPAPRVDPAELTDRLDFVLAGGAVTVIDSTIVGPGGVADVGVAVDPWPSDHLGVLSTLSVRPILPPPYVAPLATRLERGRRLDVRFHAPGGSAHDRLSIVPRGESVAAALMALAPQEVEHLGLVTFGTPMAAGAYDVVLTSAGHEVGRSPFWVVDPAEPPRVDARRTATGVEVRWQAAPGRKHDWVAIYRRGDPDLEHGALDRTYTGATVEGSAVLDPVSRAESSAALWVRLFTDDSYIVVAESAVAD